MVTLSRVLSSFGCPTLGLARARNGYSPASRREGVPRSAAPRMGRCSASSSEGLGNNSGVKIIGICTEPGARNGKKYIQAYELSEEFAGNEAPIVGAYAVIP